ncbi:MULTISPECIES: hypothetical protein [unclassified Janthinobacterium]|uniref:hypothetical protein n=1 Tax=unclassified Janthinobacterium TaxID=2610881 RepID=UPI000C70901E|nr:MULTISPECIES: hypothetical protein [unclassified Janthinobacterium]PKV46183.1 hypothetical protein CLU92_3577 [Janthinobacterium sp. 61]TDY33553.1 hypothetical protein C8C89_1343 [Janthinobacterium sp. 75]
MLSRTSLLATLLDRAMRRHGWGILGAVLFFNVMHWMRYATLGWRDARDSLFLLLIYLGLVMLLEYKRLRDAEEASAAVEDGR